MRDHIHYYVVRDEAMPVAYAWIDFVVPWFCVGLGMAILSTLFM